jgi:hypothetical protein
MSYPQKLWFALTLNLLLFAALLMSCSSCAAATHMYRRDVIEQHNAAVKVETTCGDSVHWGTGVIVSDEYVLTANHVVQCAIIPGIPLYVPPDKITVDPGDGTKREVSLEMHFDGPERDVARLRTVGSSLEDFSSPVRIGAMPELGDKVCEASAVPRWTYRCGTVQVSDGYIRIEMRVEHGNSGSALYNARGELVGIVVQLWLCEGNEFCGGRAAPLQAWPWLVP